MHRLALAVCLALSASLQPAHAEHDVRIPMTDEPESLDPQKVSGAPEARVLTDLFEGLLTLSATGDPAPGAATSWESSSDGLTWTFHLRPDGKWSNGDPLTSADFVYSFRREVDPATASPYAEALSPLANADDIVAGRKPPTALGVEAPDPVTVVLRLKRATPWLINLMAHHSTGVVPRSAIERYGDRWTRPGNMVGNGAYAMSNWVPHSEITLTRNPNFHDAASVPIATVRHILADDAHAALRRYQAGELDVVAVPGDELEKMRRDDPAELRISPVLSTTFLVVNMDRDELKDARIRQALSMVLDRETIVTKVQKGVQIPALALIPPRGIPGYTPPEIGWGTQPMPARIAAARALMQAARGPDAPPLHLVLRTVKQEATQRVIDAIAAMWKSALGVDATTDTSEWGVLENDLHRGNYQVAVYGWVADYADPWTYLANYRADAGALDIPRYRSATYDHLLDQGRATPDRAARMALLAQGEAVLLADAPLIPIEFGVTQTLVSPHLKGWEPSPLTIHPSRYFSWVE